MTNYLFRNSGELAIKIHQDFTQDVLNHNQKKYYLSNLKINPEMNYCPVNAISFYGEHFRNVGPIPSHINEEFFLNQTTDWSFNHSWQGHGDWSNHHDYISGVPSNNKKIIFMKRENV
jgi:hypothetical protein